MAAKFQIGVIGFGIGKMHSWAFSNIPHYYPEYSASDIELVYAQVIMIRRKQLQNSLAFPFSLQTIENYVNIQM